MLYCQWLRGATRHSQAAEVPGIEAGERSVDSDEWLRRRDTALDAELRKFLFSTGPITEVGRSSDAPSAPTASGSLGIGSLKGVAQ